MFAFLLLILAPVYASWAQVSEWLYEVSPIIDQVDVQFSPEAIDVFVTGRIKKRCLPKADHQTIQLQDPPRTRIFVRFKKTIYAQECSKKA